MRRMMKLVVVLALMSLCGCWQKDDSVGRKFKEGEHVKHAITGRQGVVLGNYTNDNESGSKYVLVQHEADYAEKRNSSTARDTGLVEHYYRESELVSASGVQVVRQPKPQPEVVEPRAEEPTKPEAKPEKAEPQPQTVAVVATVSNGRENPQFRVGQEVRSKRGWQVGMVVAKSWDGQYACWSYVLRIEDDRPLVRFYEPELEVRPTY